MYKPKVGDKVRVIDEYDELEYGSVHTVEEVSHKAGTINLGDCFWWNFNRFELVEESNMFDIKKEKWFIHTPTKEISDAVVTWLSENDLKLHSFFKPDEHLKNYGDQACLSGDGRQVEIGVCYSSYSFYKLEGRKEIKLTFKTVVDTVEYPVVESEKDIKLRELKETIAKAQEQIDIILENKK